MNGKFPNDDWNNFFADLTHTQQQRLFKIFTERLSSGDRIPPLLAELCILVQHRTPGEHEEAFVRFRLREPSDASELWVIQNHAWNLRRYRAEKVFSEYSKLLKHADILSRQGKLHHDIPASVGLPQVSSVTDIEKGVSDFGNKRHKFTAKLEKLQALQRAKRGYNRK